MKKFEISIKDYFEYKKPNYIFIRLTPSVSVRNYSTDSIIALVTKLYSSISSRIQTINKKLFFECQAKVGYYIYLEKQNVQFFFVVPEKQFSLFKDQIIDTWSNKITIETVDTIPNFDADCTKYGMCYKKVDAYSLKCDRRNNDLLSSQLSALHIMEQGDKAGIFYNFVPGNQKTWKAKYDKMLQDIKDGKPATHNRTDLSHIVGLILHYFIDAFDIALGAVGMGGSEQKGRQKKTLLELDLSRATSQKRNNDIIKTQIVCFSQSEDKERERNTALALCNSFECVALDNSLVYKKIKKPINLLDTKIKHIEEMRTQALECHNFICLPGRDLLSEHKEICHIAVQQTEVPADLQNGVMCLGKNCYKDNTTVKAYLPVTPSERYLSVTIVGPTRAGKTTLIKNLSKDNYNAGECVVLFDFCGSCKLSKEVSTGIKNVLKIDCSDFKQLQGLGYNEIPYDTGDPYRNYANAKTKTMQLLTLINSVNSDDRELKAKMNRYLKAASNIVFICGGDIVDIFRVLDSHEIRHNYIERIPESQKDNLKDYVDYMLEIDDKDKEGNVIGTRSNTALSGIFDRLDALKSNPYMELMLKKPTSGNFNLVDEMQKNQVICLMMPESMFTTTTEKDAYCTYWITKIWLALKIRENQVPDDKRIPVNIYVDELYQVEHCQAYIKAALSQMAKFNCKMIFSCHYVNQLSYLKEELKSASSSYILISGCDKANYKEMEEELDPYTVNDLLGLKQHTALCLIKVRDGYEKFITKLPPP